MYKKYIVANWKELPNTWAQAEELLDFLGEQLSLEISDKVDIVLCPPSKYMTQVSEILQKEPLSELVELGAQDIGVDSNDDLKNLGVEYVIIGHSSRRVFESNEIVNQKLKLAIKNGLIPIVCIGESARDENFETFLKDQFSATFAGLSADEIGKCFIAYEPVWAISTNPGAKPDSPDETRKALVVLRPLAPTSPLLYGGSVTPTNAKDFLSMPEISGVLIGGASIRKEEFVEILKHI
ncbi:MAG: hypothetical protein A3I39_00525 [Candidatus Yanofskybacteria bacterium RIFCSPLOWO2_02_FULL_47_9b]|uniref:Triosephosphate isomerase n=1 Tax=Candidatus Yanofskybacteria bacterium RIFCSPLOWO2_02_FULL_47_9b TaxID=1802708 RepID=A0A1F8H5M0_9BACT|nr:MAG: hypothetical protein A3I39_00525 [Candidatus Yanofskybacteria bacterium RIFCSPLOWO2_02_FULL_47_9b]